MPSCSIIGCKSRYNLLTPDKNAVTFHPFPTDPEIREMWIKTTGRKNWQPKKNSSICSKHFNSKAFRKTLHTTRLDPVAVPEIDIHISNTKKDEVLQFKEIKSVMVWLPEMPTPRSQSSQSSVKSEPEEGNDNHNHAERATSVAEDSNSDNNSIDSPLESPASECSDNSQKCKSVETQNEENIIEAPRNHSKKSLLMVSNVTSGPPGKVPIEYKTKREIKLEKMLNKEKIKSEKRRRNIRALQQRHHRALKKIIRKRCRKSARKIA